MSIWTRVSLLPNWIKRIEEMIKSTGKNKKINPTVSRLKLLKAKLKERLVKTEKSWKEAKNLASQLDQIKNSK